MACICGGSISLSINQRYEGFVLWKFWILKGDGRAKERARDSTLIGGCVFGLVG